MIERRKTPFSIDEEKFSTQKQVTFYVIALTSAVIAVVCWVGDVDDVKGVFNVLVPIFAGVIGYWIGSSKGAADNRDQLNKMLQPQADSKVTTTIETPPGAAK